MNYLNDYIFRLKFIRIDVSYTMRDAQSTKIRMMICGSRDFSLIIVSIPLNAAQLYWKTVRTAKQRFLKGYF